MQDGFVRAEYLVLLENDYFRTLALLKNKALALINSLSSNGPADQQERERLITLYDNIDELSSILSNLLRNYEESLSPPPPPPRRGCCSTTTTKQQAKPNNFKS